MFKHFCKMLVSVPWPLGAFAECVCPGRRPSPRADLFQERVLQSVLFLLGERRDGSSICGMNSISEGHPGTSSHQEMLSVLWPHNSPNRVRTRAMGSKSAGGGSSQP